MAEDLGVVIFGYGEMWKMNGRWSVSCVSERIIKEEVSTEDLTHVLPTGRPSTATMFDQQVTRPDLAIVDLLPEVLLCSRPGVDLGLGVSLRSRPVGLVGLGVEVVRQVFGLGPADFVDDFGLRSRGGCLAQAGGTR